ncbi:MAG: type II toxin-antitoxin system VapC family toxin [Candidatus Nezhaarchaeales archaeon]|nr:MAG: VapC toxin family PIN domain ribonuclease [Candidatus Nezhaarchaeota archaeon WYZ-LMO8]TDA36432.1 MAG: VapC toxin family PIN domain ribonuclease [Candidatus Nezhaarchaeota archaeon WYZ-LMO7]
MIVVDASILVSFVLMEPGWEKLVDLLKNSCTVDHALKEVFNAIWRAYKRNIISIEDALLKIQALRKMVDVNVKLIDEKELIDQAFMLALEHNITVYDALYVALALKLKEPLLTLDQAQAKIAEMLGIKLVDHHMEST